jgi:hypothetical protein
MSHTGVTYKSPVGNVPHVVNSNSITKVIPVARHGGV